LEERYGNLPIFQASQLIITGITGTIWHNHYLSFPFTLPSMINECYWFVNIVGTMHETKIIQQNVDKQTFFAISFPGNNKFPAAMIYVNCQEKKKNP